jgi:hypothetical protein
MHLAPKLWTMGQRRQLNSDRDTEVEIKPNDEIFTPLNRGAFQLDEESTQSKMERHLSEKTSLECGTLTFGVDSSRWRPQVALKPRRHSATAPTGGDVRCCHSLPPFSDRRRRKEIHSTISTKRFSGAAEQRIRIILRKICETNRLSTSLGETMTRKVRNCSDGDGGGICLETRQTARMLFHQTVE